MAALPRHPASLELCVQAVVAATHQRAAHLFRAQAASHLQLQPPVNSATGMALFIRSAPRLKAVGAGKPMPAVSQQVPVADSHLPMESWAEARENRRPAPVKAAPRLPAHPV